MAARPRSVSDVEILQAAAAAVSKVGPGNLTLADVASEAGVAPATLVQRFGSKRGLLLALAEQGSGTEDDLTQFLAEAGSPLTALRRYAECMAGMARSPEELANHLAFLVMDLTDPDFHALTLKHAQFTESALTRLVDDGVAAGEIRPCDSRSLARLVQETLHGALVSWAIMREGTAESWVRREIDALLAPYVSGGRGESSA